MLIFLFRTPKSLPNAAAERSFFTLEVPPTSKLLLPFELVAATINVDFAPLGLRGTARSWTGCTSCNPSSSPQSFYEHLVPPYVVVFPPTQNPAMKMRLWRRCRVFLGTKAPWLYEWRSRERPRCASCACTWRRTERMFWRGTPSTSSSRRKLSLRTRQAGEFPSSGPRGDRSMCRASFLVLLALLWPCFFAGACVLLLLVLCTVVVCCCSMVLLLSGLPNLTPSYDPILSILLHAPAGFRLAKRTTTPRGRGRWAALGAVCSGPRAARAGAQAACRRRATMR